MPDLVVESVSADVVGAYFGDTIAVTYTVRNTGNGTAVGGVVSDAIGLAADPGGPAVHWLRTVAAGDAFPLGPGEPFERTVNVDLPAEGVLATGDFYLVVETDASGAQAESDESNNVGIATSAIAFSEAPEADLVVESVAADVATAYFGETMSLTYTIRNTGGATADSTTIQDRLGLATDPMGPVVHTLTTFVSGDALPLEPTEFFERILNVELPQEGVLAPGDYYLLAETDVADVQPESDDTNNVGIAATAIALSAAPKADLVVESVGADVASAYFGETIAVTYTIRNTGGGAAENTTIQDSLGLATNPAGPVVHGLTTFWAGDAFPLGPGEPFERTLNVDLPPEGGPAPGDYYLVGETDVANVQVEADETNNLGVSSTPLCFHWPRSLT